MHTMAAPHSAASQGLPAAAHGARLGGHFRLLRRGGVYVDYDSLGRKVRAADRSDAAAVDVLQS